MNTDPAFTQICDVVFNEIKRLTSTRYFDKSDTVFVGFLDYQTIDELSLSERLEIRDYGEKR